MHVVDTHAHVWSTAAPWMRWLADYEFFRPLLRDFPLPELLRQLDENAVDRVVLVQAGTDPAETREYLAFAEQEQRVAGVVGWVSLASAEVTRRDLDSLGPLDRLVGIRHNDDWQPDGHVLIDGGAVESARVLAEHGLVLDIHMTDWRQLPPVETFVAAVPELTVVVNHLGKPNLLDAGSFPTWAAGMARLAALPSVVVKYSGWSTRLGHADPARLRPYARHLLETFGAERLLFGSNWPVCRMSATYGEVLAASLAVLDDLDEAARGRILGGNAERVYRLPT